MEKTIEELEKELADLKESNMAAWERYGSELCAGGMSAQEKALEDKIAELKSGIPKDIQFLKLDDDLLLALIGGSDKRITIRKGRRDIQLGQLLFEGARDDSLKYIVGVTEIRYLTVVNVPEDAIISDGFSDWADFYEGMKKFYPDLELMEECTVIYFEVADVTTQ